MSEQLQAVYFFSLTFVGAFSLYILSRNKGVKPFSLFYAINISVGPRAKARTIILDCVLTSLLGAFLAYAMTQPTTNGQAVAAGLSFTGIINSIATKNE